MNTTESGKTLDTLFHQAVSAIDAGDVTTLEHLLAAHSELVRERLDFPGAWLRDKVGKALDGFFQRPYLLWFVAEDPVRNAKAPRNIAEIARAIIQAARRGGVNSLREQLDYALRLVCWSWIARECGVQIQLIDVLTDAGAPVDGTHSDAAIYNGNFAAAAHLLERGAPLTLSTALCLGRWADLERLARTSSLGEKQDAFVLAALKGQAEALRRMLALGDQVEIRGLFRRRRGVINYVPGISTPHGEMEHNALYWVGISFTGGGFTGVLVDPDTGCTLKKIVFLARGAAEAATPLPPEPFE